MTEANHSSSSFTIETRETNESLVIETCGQVEVNVAEYEDNGNGDNGFDSGSDRENPLSSPSSDKFATPTAKFVQHLEMNSRSRNGTEKSSRSSLFQQFDPLVSASANKNGNGTTNGVTSVQKNGNFNHNSSKLISFDSPMVITSNPVANEMNYDHISTQRTPATNGKVHLRNLLLDHSIRSTPASCLKRNVDNATVCNGNELQDNNDMNNLLNQKQTIIDGLSQEVVNYKSRCEELMSIIEIMRQSSVELTDAFNDTYERTEVEKRELVLRNKELLKERDQAIQDAQGIEASFSDLQRRYGKLKTGISHLIENFM